MKFAQITFPARADPRIESAAVALLRRELNTAPAAVISCDIFDTVMLRDTSTETHRLATGATRAAAELQIDPHSLTRMRWMSQQNGYRAVAMERPGGEANFATMCHAAVMPFGLGTAGAGVLRAAELTVDAEHLRPHRALLEFLAEARRGGMRVIAVSDIYYSSADVIDLLERVTGGNPFDAVYTSADLGVTKHAGHIFDRVAAVEGVEGGRIVHVGDNRDSDVTNARAAGWRAVYAPRSRLDELGRIAGRIASIPLRRRRDR